MQINVRHSQGQFELDVCQTLPPAASFPATFSASPPLHAVAAAPSAAVGSVAAASPQGWPAGCNHLQFLDDKHSYGRPDVSVLILFILHHIKVIKITDNSKELKKCFRFSQW